MASKRKSSLKIPHAGAQKEQEIKKKNKQPSEEQETLAGRADKIDDSLKYSNKRTALTFNKLYRGATIFIVWLGCGIIFILALMFLAVLFFYLLHLIDIMEFIKVEVFLQRVWRIMTSASFVASILWIIMNKLNRK